MRNYRSWTNHLSALIAGTVVVGVAAGGIGTLIKSIPASFASAPADSAATGTGATPPDIVRPDAGDPRVSAAAIPATKQRANRAWCPECGIVESIVELETYADIGEHGMVPVSIDDDTKVGANDRAYVAPARRFAMTVRFRDGTRRVFHESTARNWHPGVRVIVIAGATTATR